MDNDKNKYCYKSTLKTQYGLTDSWIKKLGEPDKNVPNLHYLSGPPASLYLRLRVEALIETNKDEWEKLQKTRAKRRVTANATASRRYKETIKWAEEVKVCEVGYVPRSGFKLKKCVEEQFNDFTLWGGREWKEFTMSRNAVIAYSRHNNTNYEELLEEIKGEVGALKAYLTLKRRCNELAEQINEEVE